MDMSDESTMGPMDASTMEPMDDNIMGPMDDPGNMGPMDHHMHMGPSFMNQMDSSGTMVQYFYSGVHVIVLFKEWAIYSLAGLLGSCLLVVIFGMVYEALKFLRRWLHYRMQKNDPTDGPDYTYGVAKEERAPPLVEKPKRKSQLYPTCSSIHIAQTLLYALQSYFAYCLMLIFMTYNTFLCASVVLGLAIGYFIFGHRFPDRITTKGDCCHT